MIDSVLKGTGNSRFLKSAVPAGTSWADALAMLQAGTFPIDFNGINTDGFQQVGTPLNKANLLKDVTAAQIGLPPSTTPDGMFQALGNTGELHVWRKTVVIGSPVSAYFSLGDTIELTDPIIYLGDDSEASAYFEISNKALTVRDNGTVDNNDDAFANVRFTRYVANDNKTFYPHNNTSYEVYLSSFRGRYVRFYAISPYFNAPSSVEFGAWYYVPADATTDISRSSQTIRNNGIIISKLQKVIGHPYQPAGTTTTYPVSTNPNAWQEGSDAKEAGYTLGDIVSGTFRISAPVDVATVIYYSDSVQVDTDGTVKLVGQEYVNLFTGSTDYDNAKYLAGKFIIVKRDSMYCDLPNDVVLFIPNDTIITRQNGIFFDRYQPVTGYPAIPANTTIEYLGKLGDKARVQVVSYVGTGTYGSDHPNSLTFGSLPEAIIFLGKVDSSGSVYSFFYTQQETKVLYPKIIPNGRKDVNGYGFGYSIYGKRDGNTISWYSTRNQDCQANSVGYTFYYLVLS
nr:MAG TPA: hypothetical protein [Caudoviricetes sp.]